MYDTKKIIILFRRLYTVLPVSRHVTYSPRYTQMTSTTQQTAAIAHLLLDVFVRRRRNDGEANEKDVCLWIAQWTEPVVVFLPSGIKQPQCVWLPANHHSYSIVVKHLQNNSTQCQHAIPNNLFTNL